MEPLGSEYAIILHNPELRGELIQQTVRTSAQPVLGARVKFRFGVAQFLRNLATRIEPRSTVLELPTQRQRLSVS